MRRTWQKAKPKLEKRFRVNQQITAPEVFLINEDGENVGVVPMRRAVEAAIAAQLDLVEVNPTANPPVVKVMDYGQFKYESEKKIHKQKVQQKKVDTKGIRLSVRISEHDRQLRIDQAVKFLQRGHKLKIDLILKGREKAHPDKAVGTINDFVAQIEKIPELKISKEQGLTKQGGRFIMIIVNKKD